MQNEIQKLIEAIKADYLAWTTRSTGSSPSGSLSDINREMIKEFNENISVKEGNKYTKIIKGGSVWGFVVQKDDAKFKAGDILMAAGYNAPARNKSRGNIFDSYKIQWTGPLYLK
jgi:hypothetical protein|tara:strand:- start:50 stop:394 length:345 start_codon:yes stop_codon:yes gene_type:complete